MKIAFVIVQKWWIVPALWLLNQQKSKQKYLNMLRAGWPLLPQTSQESCLLTDMLLVTSIQPVTYSYKYNLDRQTDRKKLDRQKAIRQIERYQTDRKI